jgi:hypothetical protein
MTEPMYHLAAENLREAARLWEEAGRLNNSGHAALAEEAWDAAMEAEDAARVALFGHAY